jgi:hypothetical protein
MGQVKGFELCFENIVPPPNLAYKIQKPKVRLGGKGYKFDKVVTAHGQ